MSATIRNKILNLLACIIMIIAPVLLITGCNKNEEAYHGEKTLQNTAWGVFNDDEYNAKWFVVFYSYDQGCDVCIQGSDGQQCHYKGQYVFDDAAHTVEIRPVIDEDTPDTLPSALKGTVDAEGLHLQWNYFHEGDIDIWWFSGLFSYICPADQLG